MKTKSNFKNPASESIHEMAKILYKIGAISLQTMKEFDKNCLISDKKKKSIY